MIRRLVIMAVLIGIMLLQMIGVVLAQPVVYDLRLVDAQAALPAIKIYADVISDNDVPAKGLKAEYFKAKIGDNQLTVNKITPFEDSGEGIGYVLMVDVSKSLSTQRFDQIRSALTALVDSMSGSDQGALVIFGSGVTVAQEFTQDKASLKGKIAALIPQDEDTAFYAGIEKAIEVCRRYDKNLPTRKVILTLTDGVNDIASGPTKSDILKRLETDSVPLYIIGYMSSSPNPIEADAIKFMTELANISGGRYYDGRTRDWRGIYFSIVRAIRDSFVVELSAPGFRSEGATYSLDMSVQGSNKLLAAERKMFIASGGVVATSDAEKNAQQSGTVFPWYYVTATIVLILLILAGVWFWRKKSVIPTMFAKAANNPEVFGKPEINFAPEVSEIPRTSSIIDVPFAPIAANGVLVRLTKLSEGPPPNQFDIDVVERIIIGNNPAMSHLVFERDDQMAPAHCEIYFEDGFIYLRDLGSPSGTFVNGVAVLDRRHRIEESDVLKIGSTEMRITFPTSL